MRKLPLFFMAALLLGACRSTDKTVEYQNHEDYKSVARVERMDSSGARIYLHVDSPKISVEYLDTPRRRVIVEAVRVETHGEHRLQAKIDSLSLVNVSKTETKKESSQSAPKSSVSYNILFIMLLIILVLLNKLNKK